jgi:carbohydrate kinase (thermoresistant glucokinase family)
MAAANASAEAAAGRIVVMGPSGCGKSTVGEALARSLGWSYIEGDDFHPPANVEKMRAGVALDDADRAGWLDALAAQLAGARAAGRGAVLACSALKRSYRDRLRRGAPDLRIVYLHGDRPTLAGRLAARRHRYMPASLLTSQLAALEPPAPDEQAFGFDVDRDPAQIVAELLAVLRGQAAAFSQTILYTGDDGRARWRERTIVLDQGTPQTRLSALMASGGLQLRESPVGFSSDFHCTGTPQWVFILRGLMEIGLQDGSLRRFGPGEHFYSADTLPDGETFDPARHGHWSRQAGGEPLVTAFVRG